MNYSDAVSQHEKSSKKVQQYGAVQFSEDEKVWVAIIDWSQVRQVGQLVAQGQN